jgi:hypothetical protein
MPTPTYIALATTTLGSAAASVTFSSIPATFRDLVFVFDGIGNAGNGRITFNSDSTMTNYKQVRMYDFSGTVASDVLDDNLWNLGSLANRQNAIVQIQDYAQTDKHKTSLIRHNTPSTAVGASATRWANTNAITTITITQLSGTFSAGSTFSLYGVAA